MTKPHAIDTSGGTLGRVYGGNPHLIHIEDGKRHVAGVALAAYLDMHMRLEAIGNGSRTRRQAETQRLCPGCYMVALIGAALELAIQNGQDVRELCVSMSRAFAKLANDPQRIEEIEIDLEHTNP